MSTDYEKFGKVVDRACEVIEEVYPDFYRDRGYVSKLKFQQTVKLQVLDCNDHVPLDLDLLLTVDPGSLLHDIMGIMHHWDYVNRRFEDCWYPRCAVR